MDLPDTEIGNSSPSGTSFFRQRRLIALTSIAIAVFALVTARSVWGELPDTHLRFASTWLVPAALGFVLLQLFQAGIWWRLLRALGSPIDGRRALAIWSVSAVARYVPTSMLMPVVRVRMCRDRLVPPEICIASLVYEAVLVACGALCVAAYFIVVLPAWQDNAWRWAAIAAPVAALIFLHPRSFEPIGKRLLRRLGREPLPVALSPSHLAGFVVAYAASFVLAGGAFVAVALAFYPLTVAGMPDTVGAFSIGFIASVLVFVAPGGLGAREAALVIALSPAMPAVDALAVAVVVRLIQLSVEILFAVLTPWVASRWSPAVGES